MILTDFAFVLKDNESLQISSAALKEFDFTDIIDNYQLKQDNVINYKKCKTAHVVIKAEANVPIEGTDTLLFDKIGEDCTIYAFVLKFDQKDVYISVPNAETSPATIATELSKDEEGNLFLDIHEEI